jgi:hypothetical protein
MPNETLKIRKTIYYYLAVFAPFVMDRYFQDKVIMKYKIEGNLRVVTYSEIMR